MNYSHSERLFWSPNTQTVFFVVIVVCLLCFVFVPGVLFTFSTVKLLHPLKTEWKRPLPPSNFPNCFWPYHKEHSIITWDHDFSLLPPTPTKWLWNPEGSTCLPCMTLNFSTQHVTWCLVDGLSVFVGKIAKITKEQLRFQSLSVSFIERYLDT